MEGTQLAVGASSKSFRAGEEEPTGEDGDGAGGGRKSACDLQGARWSNAPPRSPPEDAGRLSRTGKGKVPPRSSMGHALMENRIGLGGTGWRAGRRGR